MHDLAVAHNLGDEAGTYGLVECATIRESWRVAAWTDADGRFRVQRDCWDFGRSTEMRDETGAVTGRMVVAPRVRVWAYPGRSVPRHGQRLGRCLDRHRCRRYGHAAGPLTRQRRTGTARSSDRAVPFPALTDRAYWTSIIRYRSCPPRSSCSTATWP